MEHMEQIYELAYLLPVDMAEDAIETIANKIGELLKAEKAKIIKTEKPKKMHLAYPIQKQEGAFLVSQRFETTQTHVLPLKQKLDKMSEILRLLIVKREPFAPERPKEELIKKEKIIKDNKKKEKPRESDLAEIEKELEEVLK